MTELAPRDRSEAGNQTTYAAADVVRYYSQLQQLQPAEATILALLTARLKLPLAQMSMLDIGVGAGRTTAHFAKVTAEYIGIDYSADMIDACHQRFPQADPSVAFAVGDARNMSQFADASRDFILFSYNGIDSISHADRLAVFQEVSRIGRSDGYFCFSSHNLDVFERDFNLRQQISCNPLSTYVNLVMAGLLHLFNFPIGGKQLQAVNHAILRDESHNFRLKQYYIRPEAQIRQLEAQFADVQVYSWKSGLELKTEADRSACPDLWLYYLCRIKGATSTP
jgi:ubiquinone/menaquinone biosynthesis C-methylase UbiE